MKGRLLLAAALLLAGCTAPEEEAQPRGGNDSGTTNVSGGPPLVGGACVDEGEASRNAPLLATLQEDPEQMAARMGEAMGTPLSGPPDPLEDGRLVWRDGAVSVTVVRGDDDARVLWERFEPWSPTPEEANETLQRALLAFQPQDPKAFVPIDTNPAGDVNLAAHQTYDGRPLERVGVFLTSGAYASVTVASLREIRAGLDLMDEARAADLATRAARCAMDQQGLTEDEGHATLGTDPVGLGVRGASLAYVVNVRFAEPDGESHCGRVEQVHVDAVTGKTLGVERPLCD